MEVFLLLIAIGLIIIFYFQLKEKLQNIEEKLFEIKTKQDLQVPSNQLNVKQEITVTETPKTEESTPKIENKEQKTEIIIPPVIDEKQIAFEQELNAVIAEINEQKVEPKEEHVTNEEPINLFESVVNEPANNEPIIEKSWYEKLDKNNDLEKFIGENLISKIGIAILVLGIAFFVKYAIDQNWINEIARVGIGILAGGIILGFAHYLRQNFKAFSTVLVAGGISTFYFTIGLAFQEYHLFSQTVAFAIMLVITAFSVFISIGYDRQELAILSIIGGFATPFIVSTGSGNYVVLFTYIIILDLGMLVLAMVRKWTLVNIITYVLTMLLYLSWLATKGIENADYLTNALLFASAFYIIFIAMNIAYNIKYKQYFSSIDFGILLSNTFLYFGAGITLLNHFKPEYKGAFTLILAFSNCLLAWFIIKNSKADKNLLYVLIGLALTFVTLAAPIQLKGNYITLFWAAEGALLLWLAQKSGMQIFRITSIVVYILALGSLVIDWNQQYGLTDNLPILTNKGFVASVFVCLSLLLNAILLKKDKEHSFSLLEVSYNITDYLKITQIVLVLLVYLAGLLECSYQLNNRLNPVEAAHTLIGLYHLGFSSLVIYFLNKSNNNATTIKTIGLLNIFLYLIYLNNLPFNEIQYNISAEMVNDIWTLNTASSLAFMAHYLPLLLTVYQSITIYKIFKAQYQNGSKILYWSMVILITYISSSEVILHVLKTQMVPIPPTVNDNYDPAFYANFDTYNTIFKQTVKVYLPVLWGVLSFLFLWFGIKNQIKHLRIAALYLLGATLAKLFIYDIREVSEGGKILAFILLGIVLLVISFMYQKIKAIIINDEPKETENNEFN
jgi:hypothetical protein